MQQFRLALFVLFLAIASLASAAEAPGKVLFVGNSFTYYNNSLHNHYRELVAAASPSQDYAGIVRSLTISGGYLPEHAGLPALVASESWDVVVLQGYSTGPIGTETASPFRDAAREFVGVIRDSGARPAFFMTWAYMGKPEMMALLDQAYTNIGRELDAQVVPVGLAFERVTLERPDLKLRIADRKHPTLAGTYLAACTFYAALRGESPQGTQYLAGLSADTAEYLQKTAWEVFLDYGKRVSPCGTRDCVNSET